MSGVGIPDLSRLKRKAKAIARSQGVPHGQALDLAAQEFGCENYRHARNLSRTAREFETVFVARWREPETRLSGVETLSVWLPKPWREVMTLQERRNSTRHIKFFRIVGENRLSSQFEYERQFDARERIVTAARELTFACATGLRPSSAWDAAFPKAPLEWDTKRTRAIKIPGQDHPSVWRDAAGALVIVDEPYPNEFQATFEQRRYWCDVHGYEWLAPKWTGIHAPHLGVQMQLYARKGEGTQLLQRLDAVLARMPKPVQAHPWPGQSVLRAPSGTRH